MIFALAGNQNCGKTTLFNQLTGSNQHVGNFPGVTVDQKSGTVRGQKDCTVVDLPGIYSIRPYTPEEIVTRDFILNQKPDGIINIVDATNIERNLYLTLQLLEMRIPMVLALNMMDEVTAGGGTIDVKGMSAALGIPVVPISAVKNEGVEELVRMAVTTARSKTPPAVYDFCSPARCTGVFTRWSTRSRTMPRPRVSRCALPPLSSLRTMGMSGSGCGWTRTSWSSLSTASRRWRRSTAWTATPLWRTCGTTLLRAYAPARW